MPATAVKRTASETVLIAAADLTAAGKEEFSEWDLTVAAWTLDRHRFGLRGYAQSHPDHKRVMMEIMGKKLSSPVQQKYLEKVRPNHYRLTPLGKATAVRIRSETGGSGAKSTTQPGQKSVGVGDLYHAVAVYANRPEFRRWEDNPEEPREWAGAAAFLGAGGKDARTDPAERLEEVRRTIQNAIEWCGAQEVAYLIRGSGRDGPPIHVRDLVSLLDFLQALTYRFPEKLEKHGEGKHRK